MFAGSGGTQLSKVRWVPNLGTARTQEVVAGGNNRSGSQHPTTKLHFGLIVLAKLRPLDTLLGTLPKLLK